MSVEIMTENNDQDMVYTTIKVSRKNVEKLKRFGFFGETINDCLSRALSKVESFNAGSYMYDPGETNPNERSF
jgi:hypothetical protein